LTLSRQSEIRQVEDLVVAVRGGRSRSLVVVGPAGIGKTWLCRRASELAEGFTVVATRGIESEAHLGYGGLFDVLSPLLDGRLDRLPAARGDALRGALRIAESQGADPFAVAVATLDLVAMAAEDAPVLVVVDDAPWVDAASLEALRFAARRLDADRVAFLFAARSELAVPLLDGGFESLTVEGLDTAEAVGLVNEFAGAAVEESVARRLAAAGGGHPLWLREAARELSPQQMAGAAPLTDRFRSPASVQAAFARRVQSLAAQARYALVVLSADEQAPAPVMERALADPQGRRLDQVARHGQDPADRVVAIARRRLRPEQLAAAQGRVPQAEGLRQRRQAPGPARASRRMGRRREPHQGGAQLLTRSDATQRRYEATDGLERSPGHL
jgi:hypothetical protein